MRRLFPIAGLTLLLAGCASGGQHVVNGMSPGSPPGVFGQASEKLAKLGYSIESADRQAGLIIAEKREGFMGVSEGLFSTTLWKVDTIQVIRVTLTRGAEGTRFEIRGSTDYLAPRTAERKSARQPSRMVEEDAAALKRTLDASGASPSRSSRTGPSEHRARVERLRRDAPGEGRALRAARTRDFLTAEAPT